MVKWGAVIFAVCFLILLVSLVSAAETDKASLELTFKGTDLKAVVEYKNPDSINKPEPSYEWFGVGGKISDATDNILPRYNFKKGDTIICKYRDAKNSIELRETVEIPNFPPEFEPVDMITARQGKIVNIVPKVTDIDNDELFFTYSEPFDEDGRWADTITYDPGLYTTTVTVSDGQELVSQEVIINLTGEYDDTRQSILERQQEYEAEVGKAEAIRIRRETKQFSQSKPGIDLEFDIGSNTIILANIMFHVKKELLRYTIEVRGVPLSSRPRQYEKAPGQVYQYVQIFLHDAENEDFENITLDFQIEKDWFYDNGISPYSVKLYEYSDGWESMGSAKMTRLDEHYGYEVKSDMLEGFFAVSIDPDVGETLPTGAAIGVDEQQIDFQIVNEGDGDFEGLNKPEEKTAEIEEPEEKVGEKKGWFGKALIGIIILIIVIVGFFVFRGGKPVEIPGGIEGDQEEFTREVKESKRDMRRKEKEARRAEKQKLAEEKRQMREEELLRREEEERRLEEEKQKKREEEQKRVEEGKRRKEEPSRRENRREERYEEPKQDSYDNLSEASLIEERRRLARLEEEKLEREAMHRRETERIKREEGERMSRRARRSVKKNPVKKEAPKPKKSNVKIISEEDWKNRMKKKQKEADEEFTIERMDDEV